MVIIIQPSQKKNKSWEFPAFLIFHISKSFTQNFMSLSDGDKGLRIDFVNHVFQLDDFTASNDTVDDLEVFFAIITLSWDKGYSTAKFLVNHLSQLIRILSDNHKSFNSIAPFTDQVDNTSDDKVKQESIGNETKILEDN